MMTGTLLAQSHHVKLCHLCCRIFVSDDKLIAHMKEIHPRSTVHTREEMIEDEEARVHIVWQWFKEIQRKEGKKKKKKKKKHRDDDDDDSTRMMMRHITRPRTTMTTSKLTLS